MGCGVGRRHSWDLAWLWLWCRLAATALIHPLAWELPHAAGAALKKQKKRKEGRKREREEGRKEEERCGINNDLTPLPAKFAGRIWTRAWGTLRLGPWLLQCCGKKQLSNYAPRFWRLGAGGGLTLQHLRPHLGRRSCWW